MCSLLKLLDGSKWTLFPEINYRAGGKDPSYTRRPLAAPKTRRWITEPFKGMPGHLEFQTCRIYRSTTSFIAVISKIDENRLELGGVNHPLT